MKQRKWMAVSALALIVGATSVMAAPTKTTGKVLLAAKGDKKAGNGRRGARGPQIIPAQMLEKVLGKPLTDDQKKGVQDAANAYNESVAKALGMTVDELKAKVQEYRKNNPNPRAGGKAGAKNGAA